MNKVTKQQVRLTITLGLIVATILVFANYISHHRSLLTQLKTTPPLIIGLLLLLYTLWFGALAGIMLASLRICSKRLVLKESFLLNAYSTLVNFFVPGQGGIAVRGAYLKKIHNLKVRNYVFTALLYYAFYAALSTLLLLVDSRPWWQTLLATSLVALLSYAVIYLYQKRSKTTRSELDLTPRSLGSLFIWTCLQALIQITIYFVELHRVNDHIRLQQAITYTGAANFSLFVALTPGAIGIRESFLIFSRRLHHISDANIVAANVIDRGVFLVFLGILFLLTLGFHAKYRSALSKSKVAASTNDPGPHDSSVK